MSIADESFKNTGRTSSSMETSRSSTGQPSNESISYAEGFHASPSVWLGNDSRKKTSDGYGQSFFGALAYYDPATSSLKTCQGSLLPDSETCSVVWPRAGMMRNGIIFRLDSSVPISEATECLSLPIVPRPVACDGKGSGRIRIERGANNNLRDWWNMNYRFVYPPVRVSEYLMGFHIGYTALEPSAMPLSRKSSKRSAK